MIRTEIAVWDLDATLVNSADSILCTMKAVLHEAGLEVRQDVMMRSTHRPSSEWYVDYPKPDALHHRHLDLCVTEEYERLIKPIDGAQETLVAWRVPHVIGTNRDPVTTQRVLLRTGLDRHIRGVAALEPPLRAKPAP